MKRLSFPHALVALLAAAALHVPLAVQAGEGHDHGDAPPLATGNGPKRQPDGSVFLPKPAQRQLGVRTLVTAAGQHAKAFELAGTVVMDPNAGGKVQAVLAGRLEAGPKGLPGVGQAVRKGEVLAYVVPTAGAIERSNQLAQQAELRAARDLAARRVARLTELADTVPRKDIEAAESELHSLTQRLGAVGAGLTTRDALVAPVSGVIASANAVAGQVVDARELVFEVVDPARLRIEALAYDPAQAQGVAGATLAVGGQRVPLRFVGAARSLRDQALPMQFAADSAVLGTLAHLAIGQPVRVFVQSSDKVDGVQVPVASLLRNPANQTIVWVKESPERFEPRVVTYVPLDGTTVAVTSGLKPGDRVATQGATLINQVR
ncbi:MAG: HlyD family efflux transporter periplasmic adaptor subunit [Gammaproteobacteria bacterium]|nr:HlyD family efflux transporter periplasmic adaptor subunit [Gammaproteobacteria bacterium]MBU2121172.1 HlyD family efflux transporter periplasmic adaptor subunit [Gammaproteobacteria bacterium]MBU2170196.1 HlyD family efflux transporter periplasmic adaptor subunit [Gammaproteobacteria bacterium]MBU2202757.1 HlyD family efflux transporter periplasmic adaptor subunit [Gammaproteobacteria bacterium]MBU2276496.1 HlyD family efflux transporter periplasmic adaptor subunit [Gammaproteobacteria bact